MKARADREGVDQKVLGRLRALLKPSRSTSSRSTMKT